MEINSKKSVMNKPKGKVNFDIQLSEEQKLAKDKILQHPVNFLLGKAGSGKTLLAVQIALDSLFSKEVSKIVVTRPTVSLESNGYIPGSLKEKMEPWLVPIWSNFTKVYSHKTKLDSEKEKSNIEIVSLEHFRGRTFDNAICIVDEFQNLTKSQLGMVLGRLGKTSTMILTGDSKQIDLKYSNDSAVHLVDKLNTSKYVNVTTLKDNHRHPALDEILDLLYDVT